ncbi:LOW QUALITY PROTEIN: hypothetical protein RJ639_040936 [Escallonia herrerae]|uniref:Ribosomal protein S3 n=1 Tax=Escallonia herrerae TaxID=1293975 RepID=A0AA88WE80_9ASTE|nr:LOW QUALITY PROTEIN: hypothetical protein RJ639_040936 [Escallonia herrerae]
MGQKINPLGFRGCTIRSHHPLWFSQPKNYSESLQEDQRIIHFIKNDIQKNTRISSGVEGIACIDIQKGIDLVIIYMDFKGNNRKLALRNLTIIDESAKKILIL